MGKQKNLKMIPFEPKHIELIEAREHEATGLLQIEGIPAKLITMADCSVECGTFVADGKIICCAGFYEMWEGVAEIWIIPSIHVPDYIRAFARTFKEYVDRLVGELNYHRVQTACPDDALHHRWMKWLGMEKEGVFRQYTHKKEDYCMFSRVK